MSSLKLGASLSIRHVEDKAEQGDFLLPQHRVKDNCGDTALI
ncbi:MAG TPA: hypothetical protein PK156_20725 [Polyangium sp.]|nr:hypothetical protein [Polyangium sp.]